MNLNESSDRHQLHRIAKAKSDRNYLLHKQQEEERTAGEGKTWEKHVQIDGNQKNMDFDVRESNGPDTPANVMESTELFWSVRPF